MPQSNEAFWATIRYKEGRDNPYVRFYRRGDAEAIAQCITRLISNIGSFKETLAQRNDEQLAESNLTRAYVTNIILSMEESLDILRRQKFALDNPTIEFEAVPTSYSIETGFALHRPVFNFRGEARYEQAQA